MSDMHDFSNSFKLPETSETLPQDKRGDFVKKVALPAIIASILIGLFGSFTLYSHRGEFTSSSSSSSFSSGDSGVISDFGGSNSTQSNDWAPADYNVWSGDSNVAWKWNNSSSCDTYSCWHIDFISQTGCSYFYAAINILDSSGNIVDYTNATLPALPALQPATLRFDNVQELGSKAQLASVTCN